MKVRGSCPKCDAVLFCPCKACREGRRERGQIGVDYPQYIWLSSGMVIRCPKCGFEDSADVWEEYEFQQYQREALNVD
jgi:hypothetical protein